VSYTGVSTGTITARSPSSGAASAAWKPPPPADEKAGADRRPRPERDHEPGQRASGLHQETEDEDHRL